MYFKYFMQTFLIGLISIFTIQLAAFYRNIQIRSGKMDGDTTYSLLNSSLIIVPIILFVLSLVFLQLHFKDKHKQK